MDSQAFIRASRQQVTQITKYIYDQAPGMVVQKVYRFVDGNFRAQGWQGTTFQKWKANSRGSTILVKSGALRRGMNHQMVSGGTVRFYNNVKYAGVHNRGGTIRIPERDRTIRHRTDRKGNLVKQRSNNNLLVFAKKSHKGVREKKVTVKARTITMPHRQFAPYEGSESPVLNKSIQRELEREITKILTFRR